LAVRDTDIAHTTRRGSSHRVKPGVRWCLVTPVVVVNGARQVGKTTLVARLDYPGSSEVVSLDDDANRDAARDDPRAFVSRPVDTLV
ncbi:hypothetical protein OVV29_36645, partial [Klebsiella pneumoniae]|nr:hypothetical protein [Klebsiella pneumoniae]